MKNSAWSVITFFLLAVLVSGCTSFSTPIAPTITSSPIPPTITPSPIPPTSTPTSLPTDTPAPTSTSTPPPSVEVFGPITVLEAVDLILKDYRVMGFYEMGPSEEYCEELVAKANIPELDITACEFVGVSRGFNDVPIEGWILIIPRDYSNMIWVEPNVMQHKDGPERINCYSDPPIGNIDESIWIYETSSRNIRVIFAFYDTCTGAGAKP